ncbi:Uncharacterised protein [Cedecea lapagei]|uniref:N-acetyltransferase domain-containing protein n=1 Tax=Cedecea lapagei TaxID=158823 RepID=A0A447UZ92_9ENTR|nr:GNAT family N-acetyltransferase [Cedecea lapagei]VEB95962.1 Uncharacterised protein [Cedecea lapagei]
MHNYQVDADALQSVKQLTTVWEMCVKDRGTGEVRDDQNLMILWADNPFPFWNALTNIEPSVDPEHLENTLSKSADYIRNHNHLGFLWFFEDLVEPSVRLNLPTIAQKAGLDLAFSGFGMAGDILPLEVEPSHPDLEFVRVTTEEQMVAYAEINCRAYGFPLEVIKPGFANSKFWTENTYAYLGLKDGVPVTTGAAVVADGCLFVILIATSPEHERKGYGNAITRKVLFEGGKDTGLRRATLHATAAGAPVYERIGLKKVAAINFYTASK